MILTHQCMSSLSADIYFRWEVIIIQHPDYYFRHIEVSEKICLQKSPHRLMGGTGGPWTNSSGPSTPSEPRRSGRTRRLPEYLRNGDYVLYSQKGNLVKHPSDLHQLIALYNVFLDQNQHFLKLIESFHHGPNRIPAT